MKNEKDRMRITLGSSPKPYIMCCTIETNEEDQEDNRNNYAKI